MKIPMDKVAVLACRDPTVAIDADAARVSYHFAHHVFGSVILKAEAL